MHRDNDLVDVTVRTADGKTSTIQATSRHPFWDDTLHAWVRAADLQSGHLLNTAADTHVSVTDVRNRPGSADMYNLSVSDLHTYYVLAGDASVLVHNSGCAEDVYAIEDHVIPRHTRGGAEADATKSLFDDGVDLGELAAGSAGKIGRYQAATGNIRYVITGKKIVGADRRGLPTKTYTIVREGRDGELITMHPGLPRDLEP